MFSLLKDSKDKMDPLYDAQDVARCDLCKTCLLYTSDAADDMQCVDLGGRRIIKKTPMSRAGGSAR